MKQRREEDVDDNDETEAEDEQADGAQTGWTRQFLRGYARNMHAVGAGGWGPGSKLSCDFHPKQSRALFGAILRCFGSF